MLTKILSLLFDTRLDRMTANEIQAESDAGTLTFKEVKRVLAYEKYRTDWEARR